MQKELEKVNKQLSSTLKGFIRWTIICGILLSGFYFIMEYKNSQLEKEVASTTWYETEAELTDCDSYTETKRKKVKRGGKKRTEHYDETYYTWTYTYEANDGNEYEYKVDEKSTKGTIGDIVTIYVDEKNPSHALESIDVAEQDKQNKMVIIIGAVIIMGPLLIGHIIATVVLLGRKKKLISQMKNQY